MIPSNPNVLVIDDEKGFRNEIQEYLENEGCTVFPGAQSGQAFTILAEERIDVALLDIRLPEIDGITLLKRFREYDKSLPVIMMTGYYSPHLAVQALRYGAVDFLSKPFKISDLSIILSRVLPGSGQPKQNFQSSEDFDTMLAGKVSFVGSSPPIRAMKKHILKIACTNDTTVLVTGESGTGKELVARAIHLLSKRSEEPFVPVNCSSIPEALFENEFFGHVKGSFTDARSDQYGLFESAHKGTLFLDEIGDMSSPAQAKLLRVIEDKEITRIGDPKKRIVDVRIIAATNQNLEKLAARKQFRKDLYHRLNLFRIALPRLSQRKQDIPDIFDYFLKKYSAKYGKPVPRVPTPILEKLESYPFPGNVRELMHMVEQAVVLFEGNTLQMIDFPGLGCTDPKWRKKDSLRNPSMELEAMERRLICKALEESHNNKSKAALTLNISRQALNRKIKKHGIKYQPV